MSCYKRITARIPCYVWNWVKEQAEHNERSANGEVVYCLKEAKEQVEKKKREEERKPS